MAPDHTLTRRRFASAALVGLAPKTDPAIAGGFVYESQEAGHRIRDKVAFRTPGEVRKVPVVIVGGGIAGLSAAWWLDKCGYRDYAVLEMEAEAGGNARSGHNDITAYPWAAHYVPVPARPSTLVRELFTDLGLLEDGVWNERWLCHSPQERLYLHGHWQDGLEPASGVSAADREQFARFEHLAAEAHASQRFTIPMQQGWVRSTAKERALDQQTMAQWMDSHGLYSPHLRWYVDYACRDDYGTSLHQISAWAGLHYFASREPETKGPLTWPEGNGWIVRRLLERIGPRLRTGSMVHRIVRQKTHWDVLTEATRYQAAAVIFAAPTFLASWLVDPAPPPFPVESAPWMTANLTLHRWPGETESEPAWENVIYDSKSLGYVVATHQNLNTFQPRTVWTWYHAFADGRAADQRRVLLGGDWRLWKEFILADLERAHPDIRQCVSRVDVLRLGHAMPRPSPGVMFRAYPGVHQGSLWFANCDLSRLSLFEEAQFRGVEAARKALALVAR